MRICLPSLNLIELIPKRPKRQGGEMFHCICRCVFYPTGPTPTSPEFCDLTVSGHRIERPRISVVCKTNQTKENADLLKKKERKKLKKTQKRKEREELVGESLFGFQEKHRRRRKKKGKTKNTKQRNNDGEFFDDSW